MHRLRRFAGAAIVAVAAAVALTPTSAHAAVPDVFGFVLWNGSPTPANAVPPTTTVTLNASNTMTIVFPGLAAPGGVVHVTAVNDAARWCQVLKFAPVGTDEVVEVACFAPGGVLTPTRFSAFFESSSASVAPAAGPFGYVDVLPSTSIVSQFNSAGGVNTATGISPGLIQVSLPGLGTPGPMDGSFQATAVDSSIPAWCKVRAWRSSVLGQTALVACYNAGGAPYPSRFTLTYQYKVSLYGAANPPTYFGYLYNAPLGGPASTNYNNLAGGSANTVVFGSVGRYEVTFPKLWMPPDNLQLTASGGGPEFCNLVLPWFHQPGFSDTLTQGACYSVTGVRTNAGFLISDSSAL